MKNVFHTNLALVRRQSAIGMSKVPQEHQVDNEGLKHKGTLECMQVMSQWTSFQLAHLNQTTTKL